MHRPRRRKGHRQRQGTPKEATILIPLTFNDGSSVPGEVLQSILEEIYLAFHGWTVEGTVKGAYRMHSGRKRVEEHLKLSVLLDSGLVPQLERMIGRWCAKLDQETMLLKIADPVVRMIPPRHEKEQS